MKIIGNSRTEAVKDDLTKRIITRLDQNIPVLLLLSGGSTASVGVEVCNDVIAKAGSKKDNLKWLFTVSLIDERFGPVGHADSNWKLLLNMGLNTEKPATIPLLKEKEGGAAQLESAVLHFDSFLNSAVEKKTSGNLFITALLGIGPDGHTAGILPDSPPALIGENDTQYAAGYKAALFTRITATPAFFTHIDLAILWAAGQEKKHVIEDLKKEIGYSKQPAQCVKLAKDAILYTDQQI